MIPESYNYKYGSTQVKYLYQGNILVWPTLPEVQDNQILYISTDSSIVTPGPYACGNSNILSNTYTNIGTISCDSSILEIGQPTFDGTPIQNYAFASCPTLMKVYLPNTVTCLGVSAFFNCEHLSYILIPFNVL